MDYINMFLSVCGAISIIGGACAVLWKAVRPAISTKERLDRLEKDVSVLKDLQIRARIEKLEQHQKELYDQYQDIKALDTMICKSLIQIMEHQISGNHVDELKKTKQDMIAFLADHQ